MAEEGAGNENNSRNPKKIKYIEPKESDDPEMADSPGLTASRRYNDIFGNDFKITIDTNGDGVSADAFYGKPEVNRETDLGLVDRRKAKGAGDAIYVHKGEVMIWTFGPDMEYSDKFPGPCHDCERLVTEEDIRKALPLDYYRCPFDGKKVNGDGMANRDNILSWR